LFSYTQYSLRGADEISHPYETSGKINP
jgi:hypothetical protein